MTHETPDDLPFDKYVPWKPEKDSGERTVQDFFDYVDSLQDLSARYAQCDEITFKADHTFGFTSRERDTDEELQYNQTRYYDATPGR